MGYRQLCDILTLNTMVSAALLNFVSQLFANIHNNDIAFGGINMIVAGDLAQLPPVGTIWYLFYPLFLCQPRRQQDDKLLYQIIEEIRLGNIFQSSWNEMTKGQLTTTHINHLIHYSHRRTADQINQSTCK